MRSEKFNRMKREMFCESDEILGNTILELELAYEYLEQAYILGVFAMRDTMLKNYPVMDFGMVANENLRNNIIKYSKELTDDLEVRE